MTPQATLVDIGHRASLDLIGALRAKGKRTPPGLMVLTASDGVATTPFFVWWASNVGGEAETNLPVADPLHDKDRHPTRIFLQRLDAA